MYSTCTETKILQALYLSYLLENHGQNPDEENDLEEVYLVRVHIKQHIAKQTEK